MNNTNLNKYEEDINNDFSVLKCILYLLAYANKEEVPDYVFNIVGLSLVEKVEKLESNFENLIVAIKDKSIESES